MQTFLPYDDFARSAGVLDRQRLGKQRVENLQILKALADPGYGWQNHPAVKMWKGHEYSLFNYQIAICSEWVEVRGYKDTCFAKSIDVWMGFMRATEGEKHNPESPWWIGDEDFHRAHRSNLLRKNIEHYRSKFERGLRDDLPYLWPQDEPGVFLIG